MSRLEIDLKRQKMGRIHSESEVNKYSERFSKHTVKSKYSLIRKQKKKKEKKDSKHNMGISVYLLILLALFWSNRSGLP